MEEVKQVMRVFEMVSWKHVRKKCNIVAQKLARSALKLNENMYCQEVGPPWLHNLVEEDIT